MKKYVVVLVFVLFAIAVVGLYLILKRSEIGALGVSGKPGCISTDTKNTESIIQTTDFMRAYMSENGDLPLSTKFSGALRDGSDCYYLKIGEFELYEDTQNNMIILKNGKIYKKVASQDWKK